MVAFFLRSIDDVIIFTRLNLAAIPQLRRTRSVGHIGS